MKKLLSTVTFLSLILMLHSYALGENWVRLDNFSNYTSGDSIRGKGPDNAWRFRGWPSDNGAIIAESDEKKVLKFNEKKMALFEHQPLFFIEPGGQGTLFLRIMLPKGNVRDQGTFFIIVKTLPQSREDLTRPGNGILLFHIEHQKSSGMYRLRMEGEGPSPSESILTPGVWTNLWISLDMNGEVYRVFFDQDGGYPIPVTTHRYVNGIVPFKNTHDGSGAEMIYLRNQSIDAPVLVDSLYFKYGRTGNIPTSPF